MKQITLSYFSLEDVLFINISKEKSVIGDQEFQEDVILYRGTDKKVIGIEVQKFTEFKESKIQINQNRTVDMSVPFNKIRMLISLRDIMFSDPIQFEETLKEWGIDILKERLTPPKDISIKEPCPDCLCYT